MILSAWVNQLAAAFKCPQTCADTAWMQIAKWHENQDLLEKLNEFFLVNEILFSILVYDSRVEREKNLRPQIPCPFICTLTQEQHVVQRFWHFAGTVQVLLKKLSTARSINSDFTHAIFTTTRCKWEAHCYEILSKKINYLQPIS